MNNNKSSTKLTSREKLITMRSIFEHTSTNQKSNKYVKNIGDFISGNFEKIDGFDYRWSSLITNNPLLFEDIDYLRVKPFIDNQCTEKEIEAYRNGELRELYATFDNMLMCNLRYYDRIMSFCTMVFMGFIRINDNVFTKKLDTVPLELSLTPTQIWCAALTSTASTEWELKYAWGKPYISFISSEKSILEQTFQKLYKNVRFARFVEYNSIRVGVSGFRQTLLSDKTSNRKLAQVCSKFTRTSTAISEQQLDTIFDYHKYINKIYNNLYEILNKCLSVLFNGDSSQYCIFIYTNEIYLFTSKFQMKINRNDRGVINKEYIANSYECFAAEEFLVPAVKAQIEWARSVLPSHFEFDKQVLISIFGSILETNYRDVIAVNRIEKGIFSKCRFSGIFSNIKITEEYFFDNRIISSSTKVLSKKNAAKYLVNRGYTVFGTLSDMNILDSNQITNYSQLTKQMILNHYSNYCVPVIQHMGDVITAHELSKEEIKDVLLSGVLNPDKINNDNIQYVSVYNINEKDIFSKGLDKQNKLHSPTSAVRKKSYWSAITTGD